MQVAKYKYKPKDLQIFSALINEFLFSSVASCLHKICKYAKMRPTRNFRFASYFALLISHFAFGFACFVFRRVYVSSYARTHSRRMYKVSVLKSNVFQHHKEESIQFSTAVHTVEQKVKNETRGEEEERASDGYSTKRLNEQQLFKLFRTI